MCYVKLTGTALTALTALTGTALTSTAHTGTALTALAALTAEVLTYLSTVISTAVCDSLQACPPLPLSPTLVHNTI